MKERAFHMNEYENRQWPTVADWAAHNFSWKLKCCNSLRAPTERPRGFAGVIMLHMFFLLVCPWPCVCVPLKTDAC